MLNEFFFRIFMKQGPFFHVVYFWMNHPESESDITQLELELKRFISLNKQVVSHHIGRPAGTDREVVDNTYGVSLIVSFDSKEAQDVYQSDPTHLEFIERAKHLWKRVQIYDSLVKES